MPMFFTIYMQVLLRRHISIRTREPLWTVFTSFATLWQWSQISSIQLSQIWRAPDVFLLFPLSWEYRWESNSCRSPTYAFYSTTLRSAVVRTNELLLLLQSKQSHKAASSKDPIPMLHAVHDRREEPQPRRHLRRWHRHGTIWRIGRTVEIFPTFWSLHCKNYPWFWSTSPLNSRKAAFVIWFIGMPHSVLQYTHTDHCPAACHIARFL